MRHLYPTIILLASLHCPLAASGPYFGNGMKNGYADQTSIILWTRLTRVPDGNQEGPAFVTPKYDHRTARLDSNPAELLAGQLPAGVTLDQMEGACPGAPGQVMLSYFPRGNPQARLTRDWASVDPLKNYTHQWQISGLAPDTAYVVELQARADAGSPVSARMTGAFRTPPPAAQASEITFTIVTCHDYGRRDSPDGHLIYAAMRALAPDFYVHTGDIEYYDRPDPFAVTESLMRFKWDRYFALPLQREFLGRVTSYFMKDDHDILANDASPGRHYGTVTYERGLQIFDEQFPAAGVPYKSIRWGRDLEIWITEGRIYRSNNQDPDGPEKTLFGAEQKAWLFRTLGASEATFKLLIVADPILGPDRPNKRDNLANSNWAHEGNEVRTTLDRIGNVLIVTGDRHWQYVSHLPGTNLWEFSVGAGSDQHAGGWPQDDIRPEHRFLRLMGGFLSGNVTRDGGKPRLTLHHRSVEGQIVHTEVFER